MWEEGEGEGGTENKRGGEEQGRAEGGGRGTKKEKHLCLLLFLLALFQLAKYHIMAAIYPLWKIERSKLKTFQPLTKQVCISWPSRYNSHGKHGTVK